MLFLNSSSPINHTDPFQGVEQLLPNIMSSENLTESTINDLMLNNSLKSLQVQDEESSESGVSTMGSSNSPIHVSVLNAVMLKLKS